MRDPSLASLTVADTESRAKLFVSNALDREPPDGNVWLVATHGSASNCGDKLMHVAAQ